MLAHVYSFGIHGLDAYTVTIETDISPGLPSFTIVGLPDNAVKESRERVRTAIKHSGYDFPQERITINLAPADTKKQGPSFDAAIALSILCANGDIDQTLLATLGIVGELSLSGDLKPAPGTLAMAMACQQKGCDGIVVPQMNAAEASLVKGLTVYPVKNLSQLLAWLTRQAQPPEGLPTPSLAPEPKEALDFADVKAQLAVKRGLEVAAAGGHNVLLVGPPGSGKTMLAKRISTILPPLTNSEALEVTRIYSVANRRATTIGLIQERPMRSPHHTSSHIALIGGGSFPMPGEVTLAHHGILFLDELPEFPRYALETLRQPLEDGYVNVARAKDKCLFPAKFMLVAAMNPCPCGFRTDTTRSCRCTPATIDRYQQRISGPLLDRIDIHVHVPALTADELLYTKDAETSAAIRQRILKARLRQDKRLKDEALTTNAQMQTRHIRKFCALSPDGQSLLSHAVKRLGLSARAHDKVLKVARTISDLSSSDKILPEHLAEAISYRCLDKMNA